VYSAYKKYGTGPHSTGLTFLVLAAASRRKLQPHSQLTEHTGNLSKSFATCDLFQQIVQWQEVFHNFQQSIHFHNR